MHVTILSSPATRGPSVHCIFMYQTTGQLPVLGIFNVRIDVDACDCCADTVRESALKVNSGSKTLCGGLEWKPTS